MSDETVTIPKTKLQQIVEHLDRILKLLRGENDEH